MYVYHFELCIYLVYDPKYLLDFRNIYFDRRYLSKMSF